MPSSSAQPASYPCSPLQVFFSFLFFFFYSLSSEPVSCDIAVAVASTSPRSHRQYPIAATSSLVGTPTTRCTHPHMGCGHTQATPLPSPSPCLVHLQKKPQISHFPFFPFIFNGAGHLPLVRMQAAPSPSPQPPPLHCLYDWRHFTDPVAATTGVTRLCHTDRGCKRCAGPHHFRDTPICSPSLCVGRPTRVAAPVAPRFTRPTPPAVLPCMPGDTGGTVCPSPLCRGYASPAPRFMRPAPHALFVHMPVGARRTACPSQSPSAGLRHPPPPGLRNPPRPHAFPLCAHAGGAGRTGGMRAREESHARGG